ncbi:hypothetical protein OIU74_026179 [Salix koriyanagi]|uniref:Uncharacterized protein n=1 Tax=Salix koriyanagi TaxID=2511006 RepID=A0A9Q0W064_9ROSI|nr:hypothetical protein OIU74_026179 [Salix koriyanagi]
MTLIALLFRGLPPWPGLVGRARWRVPMGPAAGLGSAVQREESGGGVDGPICSPRDRRPDFPPAKTRLSKTTHARALRPAPGHRCRRAAAPGPLGARAWSPTRPPPARDRPWGAGTGDRASAALGHGSPPPRGDRAAAHAREAGRAAGARAPAAPPPARDELGTCA